MRYINRLTAQLTAAIFFLLAANLPTLAVQAAPPNIVLILADDFGYGDAGCYNPQAKFKTPHIDSLAKDGMRFTQAYSPAAVCVPSRYGLLTGQHPFRGEPHKWTSAPTIAAGQATIATMLKKAGYATACVGKWHCGFEGGVTNQNQPLRGGPLDRGFDRFYGQHGSLDQPPYFYIRDRRAVMPATGDTPGSQEEGFAIKYQGRFWRKGKIAPNFKHDEVLDRYAAQAELAIRGHHATAAAGEPAKPFFLYFALTAPHGPWLPGKAFQGKSQAGPLGDFVMHVDDVVGRILKTLDELKYTDNTLVVFSSDNGPLWFEGNVKKWGHRSSGVFRGQKGDIWEGGIRMPLLARLPGSIPAGKVSDQMGGLIDLFATFASVAGQKLEDGHAPDSFTMWPAMTGQESTASSRTTMLVQSLNGRNVGIRKGDWKLIPWLGSGGFLGSPARVKPTPGGPAGQLYNLATDPGEQNNLYSKHPEVVKELTLLLKQQRAAKTTR